AGRGLGGEQHVEHGAGPFAQAARRVAALEHEGDPPAALRLGDGAHDARHLVETVLCQLHRGEMTRDRKSTRLNSSHVKISYAVFCLKKKKNKDRLNYTLL